MWIPVTLVAACLQIARTDRQHQLRDVLGPTGAGFVRYLYGMPLAWAAATLWFTVGGATLPSPTGRFWPWVVLAGAAQIVATVALLMSFRWRDFAVGTVYAKSEVILVAVFSALLLDEPLRPLGWWGAAACTAGVAWLAGRGSLRRLLGRAGDPAALLGLAAGGLFGIAAIGIRGASTALGDAPAVDRALLTLTVMLSVQVVLNGTVMAVADRAELIRTLRAWRPAVTVGLLSLGGSAAWALAMTLENAAKVRTLGQIELVLAFVIARRRGDRHRVVDVVASALVLLGVVIVARFG